jgi:hypothetical protein
MRRTVLFGFLVLALVGSVYAAAGQTPETDLTGVYACEGVNPDGTPYAGVVEILKVKDTYLVRWTMPNDNQVVGVGILSNGVLAVSYFGGSPAVVAFSTTPDGRLDGKWTMGGAEGSVFSEKLTKMSAGQQQQQQRKPIKRETKPGISI